MVDVAPTLLALMGCPAPAHMDGRAVAPALDTPPPEPKHGEADWTAPSDAGTSVDDETAMRQNLKDLGYM
jgi:arylsulfatase A-like enzyme